MTDTPLADAAPDMDPDTVPDPDVAPEGPAPTPASNKPQMNRFRKKYSAVRLSPDQARRQGEVSRIAWTALGGRDAVVAFLNTQDDELGGRPLDLAVDSDEGMARVLEVIAARAAPQG
jgi:hypothetical protein